MRPPPSQRTYVSPAVDALIASYTPRFIDPNLGTLFANTLPNALDTTVSSHTSVADATPGNPADTFIITGDIDAMWLRDSTNQVLPYVALAGGDAALRDLLRAGSSRGRRVAFSLTRMRTRFNRARRRGRGHTLTTRRTPRCLLAPSCRP